MAQTGLTSKRRASDADGRGQPSTESRTARGADLTTRRRTKIICTLGPATDSPERIEALIRAGMDVARLNFSHGTRDEHAARIERVRKVAGRFRRPVALLQDLAGPKIRLGDVRGGRVWLAEGAVVRLTNDEVLGTPELLSTTYYDLPNDVAEGDEILLDDGLLRLEVLAVEGREVACRVTEGGVLKPHKGINLPGVEVTTPSMTRKDEEDVRFGLEHGVDYIALSFVRRAADIEALKKLIAEAGRSVPVIAKLEKPQAIESLDEIFAACEGVMIARGDLGVEIPLENVPVLQKQIIERANAARKLVIVATQMLNSMTEHSRPTRAETSDVSNAIFDATDAVMLSSETASGKYPIEAVEVMARIILAAEAHLRERPTLARQRIERNLTFTDAITDAACTAAVETNARLIACFSQTGKTVGLLAKYRPPVPVVAFSPFEEARRRMSMFWGVDPHVMEIPDNIDRLIAQLERRLLEEGLASEGETVVIVCGAPLDVPGRTNLLKLHTVGDVQHHLT
jgi:pyruvate kinase